MFQFDRTARWPRSAVGVEQNHPSSMMNCAALATAGLSAATMPPN
ncbi:hypothetical protein I314_05944 [Cryptococcus bacillisporus CA1873]|uniref:Uncharacterized protein n=1 Tax=Cryptococcus bacillisporus CA1873 TaxID=1296111 RepID=A0ABR5B410_CRYGA|nr:hypothetical protein I314_05944 [Cryptococcus bacillisporus CA1873]|eukprot:KIR58318.1 hypothetical protein I314_05944 [Cryptococcus gattii CA1873]